MTRTQETLTTATAAVVAAVTWRYHARHWDSLTASVLPWLIAGALAVFLCRPGGHAAALVRCAALRVRRAPRRRWFRVGAVAAALAVLAVGAWAYPSLRHGWRERSVRHFYGPGHAVYTETASSRYELLWKGMVAHAPYAGTKEIPPAIAPNLQEWLDGIEEANLKAFSPPELKNMRDADDKARRLRAAGKTSAEIDADFEGDAIMAAITAKPEERAAAATWHRVTSLTARTGLPEDVVAARLDDVEAAAQRPDFDRVAYLLALPRPPAK